MAKTTVRGEQITDATVSLTADVKDVLPLANGGTATSSTTTLPRTLLYSSGWPDRPADSRPTIFVGGGISDAPTDTDLAAGDLWIPATAIASKRINSAASNATPALDNTYAGTVLTAQAAAITAFSLSGTFGQEQQHMVRIKDNGTARAITWTSSVVVAADNITLPTTTVVGKTHRIGLIYDEVIGKMVAWAVGTV